MNSITRNNLARVTSTGLLDTSFNPNVVGITGINAIIVQSDGSIVFGGGFTSVGGTSINHIARITSG